MRKNGQLIMVHLLIATAISACSLSSRTETPPPVDWQKPVDSVRELHDGLEFPSHFLEENAIKLGGEFDPNRYFDALSALSMQPGYTLDYVYDYQFMGGRPLLYARQESVEPLGTAEEYYRQIRGAPQENYLEHVQIDDSPEGYFQFVVLAVMAEQFYLYWHAAYNDRAIVCEDEGLEALRKKIISSKAGEPDRLLMAAQELDLTPRVKVAEDEASVRIITFSNWAGFVEETYTIRRDFPHAILAMDRKTLIPYDSGIQF